MKNFKPYKINHVALDKSNSWELPQGNSLNYFWWNKRALSHFWLEPEKEVLDIDVYKSKLIESIYPVINHEISIRNDNELSVINWAALILQDNFVFLNKFFEMLFKDTIIPSKENISQALTQTNGALKLSLNYFNLYEALKLYIKVIIRYKI